LALKR